MVGQATEKAQGSNCEASRAQEPSTHFEPATEQLCGVWGEDELADFDSEVPNFQFTSHAEQADHFKQTETMEGTPQTEEEPLQLQPTNSTLITQTRSENPVTVPRKRGRPAGSKNVVSKEKKQLQFPAATKFSLYWTQHQLISNPNKAVTPYC